ncbi:MAG: hypothetical protein JEY94_13170 [Melioribacteraceae bacterium]|nr:hypothetical protein [Melioribacteraceae bacterium]
MPEQNDVSIVIPPEILTEVETAVATIKEKLSPYLVALTPSERHELPKMRDKTIPFVEKTLNYAESSPEFAPPYMKVDEMKVDVTAVENLKSVLNPIQQIDSNLDDTVMVCGSEAYVAALSYYNSVKLASKMDIPNAKPIYDDLKQRFAKTKKNGTE